MTITKKEIVKFRPSEIDTLSAAMDILLGVYASADEGGHLEKMAETCLDYLREMLSPSREIE